MTLASVRDELRQRLANLGNGGRLDSAVALEAAINLIEADPEFALPRKILTLAEWLRRHSWGEYNDVGDMLLEILEHREKGLLLDIMEGRKK